MRQKWCHAKLGKLFRSPGRRHVESSTDIRGRNASYWSETIQNEIIDTLGNYICSKRIAEVKQSRMLFIMADEAADVSKKEKLSVVLSFVGSKNIPEECVGFRQCGEETTGNAIKEFIINSVRDLGLVWIIVEVNLTIVLGT